MKVKNVEKGPKCVGRPRGFCADAALDRALDVFWEKGYEGTSLPDLTAAMGINRPSLYAAFGNKEELFRKSMQRYQERMSAVVDEAKSQPTARAFVEFFLRRVAVAGTSSPQRGCFLVQTATACSTASEPIRRDVVAQRCGTETVLRERFEQAITENELPRNTSAADLAKYYAVILQGLSLQAAAGATEDELMRVVKTAMCAWPMQLVNDTANSFK